MSEDLERELAALAGWVAIEPVDIAQEVGRRVRAAGAERPRVISRWRPAELRPVIRPVWHRAVAVAAAILLLAGATLGLSPGARDAVADLLGLGGVRITTVPTLPPVPSPSLGTGLTLGRPVTLTEAQAGVPFPIVVPADLGEPDEAYLDQAVAGGQVSLLYRARPGLPQASTTGTGLLLTEFQARVDRTALRKYVGPSSMIRSVSVNGDHGYWLAGLPHELLYLGPNGEVIQQSIRLAGNVLLWQHDGVTLRMEADVGLQQALRYAGSAG